MNPKFELLSGCLQERIHKDWIDKLFPPESEVASHSLPDSSTPINSSFPYFIFSNLLSSPYPFPVGTFYFNYITYLFPFSPFAKPSSPAREEIRKSSLN